MAGVARTRLCNCHDSVHVALADLPLHDLRDDLDLSKSIAMLPKISVDDLTVFHDPVRELLEAFGLRPFQSLAELMADW